MHRLFAHKLECAGGQQFACGEIAGAERTTDCVENGRTFEFCIRHGDGMLPGEILGELPSTVKAEVTLRRAGQIYMKSGRTIELPRLLPAWGEGGFDQANLELMCFNKTEKLGRDLVETVEFLVARVKDFIPLGKLARRGRPCCNCRSRNA